MAVVCDSVLLKYLSFPIMSYICGYCLLKFGTPLQHHWWRVHACHRCRTTYIVIAWRRNKRNDCLCVIQYRQLRLTQTHCWLRVKRHQHSLLAGLKPCLHDRFAGVVGPLYSNWLPGLQSFTKSIIICNKWLQRIDVAGVKLNGKSSNYVTQTQGFPALELVVTPLPMISDAPAFRPILKIHVQISNEKRSSLTIVK